MLVKYTEIWKKKGKKVKKKKKIWVGGTVDQQVSKAYYPESITTGP